MGDQNLYPVELEDLYPGTTFFYWKDSYAIPHLHIILTDPDEHDGSVVVVTVNITTHEDWKDPTVILSDNDHPYIEKPSSIAYVYAELFSVEKLLRYINEEKSLHEFVLEDDVIQKICEGVMKSPFTPLGILKYWQDKFLTE